MLGAVVILIATGKRNSKKNRQLDERITLRRQDKIPYGTYVAYQNLKHIFPGAKIFANKYEPGYWDSLSNYDDKQVFISICDRFSPDEEEMKRMISFAENGNDVFISARYISATADRILHCNSSAMSLPFINMGGDLEDSMHILLNNPLFGKTAEYEYPGRTFNSYFKDVDTNTTDILGFDIDYKPNFIRLHAGKGNFYIHTEPLAFSNYFILHKNNADYYEKVLSVIRRDAVKVLWDEYFLNKREYDKPPENKKGWLATLMGLKNDDGKKSFAAAFWLLIGLLLTYVLMQMRRKQRYIPVITKPKNDSLDFVKTIGRLYYDKGDNKNLCHKMGAYFLEHIRNRYKLPTGNLDEPFIKNLLYKSAAQESTIRSIVSFIKYLDDAPAVSKEDLTDFHKQLETFYSTS
jgi:hypothetical protein